MDEETVRECADAIRDYCSQFKDNCVGCIFYRTVRMGDTVVEGDCILQNDDPEKWDV